VVVVEIKGHEDLDVPLKMRRLRQWCEDVNRVQTDLEYDFVYVHQESFERYKPASFGQLARDSESLKRRNNTLAIVRMGPRRSMINAKLRIAVRAESIPRVDERPVESGRSEKAGNLGRAQLAEVRSGLQLSRFHSVFDGV